MTFKINSMFKSTYIKLTLFYVLVVMCISIAFSVAIYQISSKEINRGLDRQVGVLCDSPGNCAPLQDSINQIRNDQISQSNQSLQTNLIYFNILILLLSSVGSYFFARFTFRPVEEAFVAQNRFSADASHELRTPLSAMRSEIEVALRDKKLGISESRKLLESNLEEISKLEALSKSLLKLAKLDHEEAKNFQTVNLASVIAESYEKVEKMAKLKNIKINCQPPLDSDNCAGFNLKADQQSLVELFVILLDNALKYSPKNSSVEVKIEKNDKHFVVRVTDHGEGIKASDLPHIFSRFYRADNSRSKNKVDGYGLGLSIAKNIVELHHGEITAKSLAGNGSEFTVKI